MGAGCKEVSSIESLPDKVLLRIFSFLKHQEMMKYSVVSKNLPIDFCYLIINQQLLQLPKNLLAMTSAT